MQLQNDYFTSLEEAAEHPCEQTRILLQSNSGEKAAMENLLANNTNHISNTARLHVRVLPVKVIHDQPRGYDQHRREILLSGALRRPQFQFHLLVHYAFLSQ